MDFQNYQPNKRNASMEAAAFVLSIISITACACLYISIPCGALAIILALLSKGGSNSMSSHACLALGLGIAGLIFTLIVYGFAFTTTYLQYGSLDAMLRDFYNRNGLDYDALMQQLQSR